jgi:hypothetical protein
VAESPNGWFHQDVLFFGRSLSPATVFSRGAEVHMPELKSADVGTREAYYHGLGTWMNTLGVDEAVQFQWRVDSDYESELEGYRQQTVEQGACGWCKAVRDERYLRFKQLMEQGQLRREKFEVWVGKRASTIPKKGLQTAAQFDGYIAQVSKTLADRLEGFGSRMPECRVDLMDDAAHFRSWRSFLNPSLRLVGEERTQGMDRRATILENCWPGGGVSTTDGEGVVYFKMDGYYHAFLVLRQWPLETYFGIIWALTSALGQNYSYTLNCYPLDPQAEIKKTNVELKRVNRNAAQDEQEAAQTVALKKKAKIAALQSGFARPFSVLPVIRVWNAKLDVLQGKLAELKEAIISMNGARYAHIEEPSTAKHIFFETLPGWLGGRYRGWDLFAVAGADPTVCFLQDMVPMSSSYTGHMEEGEAMWEGDKGNLVGVRAFANGVPQHGCVIGSTRVGKSSQVIDYVSQTDCFMKFRSIVEEGMSYASVVRLLGGESLVLNPDGDITLNYFDTQGVPLTQSQVTLGAGLLGVMAGRALDPEVNVDRKAMYSEYINSLYQKVWQDWCMMNPEGEMTAARWAILIEDVRRGQGVMDALGTPEIWSDLHAQLAENPGIVEARLAAIKEDDVIAFSRRPETAVLTRNVGMAFLKPEEFPTHSALVETMQFSPMAHHDEREVMRLSSRLRSWTRYGGQGRLFDGPSNRRITGRLVHFELSLIPSSNPEMKEAVLFLLGNVIRQHVMSLPRGWKKEGIYEEPSRYINVGGAKDLFSELYAQMAKYSYRILPVTQQYAQLAQSELRPIIFGNSKQYWLFRQNDLHDMDDLGDAVGLSDAVKGMVRGYSAPEFQTGPNRFSEMAIWCQEGNGKSCGTVRNYATREMLYVSESSGDVFDQRMKALAEYEDPVMGVMAEAEKAENNRRAKKKPARTI